MSASEAVQQQLRALNLSTAAQAFDDVQVRAERGSWSLARFTQELCALELEGRRQNRVARLMHESHLPSGKTLAAFDQARLPVRLRRQLAELCTGEFVGRAENALLFGLPGRGKTHYAAAVGHALVELGHRVLFTPTFRLVDELLRAKRDLDLDRALRRLDRYAVLILDDLGYVQQSRDEMEVLFTLLAERYERRSVIITSNLVFSEWERIFKDPLTTAAAIDRLVHHCIIVEFGKDMRSQRAEQAAQRRRQETA
jgi:DNA replication protein DnaC